MFLAGFRQVDVVGTCQRLDNPHAPIWSSVQLSNVEAMGCGTLAYQPDEDRILAHIHVSVGLKEHSATAHTSHLLGARVQFLTEMLLVEALDPCDDPSTQPEPVRRAAAHLRDAHGPQRRQRRMKQLADAAAGRAPAGPRRVAKPAPATLDPPITHSSP